MEEVPTVAERLHSLLRSTSSLDVVAAARRVQLLDSHSVEPGGKLALRVPADSALGLDLLDGPLPTLIEVTDIAPVAMRDRIRARATLAGGMRLTPRPDATAPLLAVFTLSAADLHDGREIGHVGPVEFAAAAPDLLACREAALLCHLVDAHADLVSWLARLVAPEHLHGVRRVHPLRLDRYGVVLRLEMAHADRDVRLPFTTPLRSPDDAPSRMLELLARARACRRVA